MELLQKIAAALERGDDEQVATLTAQALEQGHEARSVLDGALVAGMRVVGGKFKAHEIFLPDVLLAARAMYAGLDLLRPILAASDVPARATVVLGSVQGDLHDIGKNLVGIMLKGAGYNVVDLGNDVAPQRFVDVAEAEGALVVGCSALLTTTMTVMKQVAQQLAARGLRGRVKLIVGGAPLSAGFAEEIGADAYGYDAVKAVELVDGFAARS